MSPWRKRKLADDDEPLVPQGFITQSLDADPRKEERVESNEPPTANPEQPKPVASFWRRSTETAASDDVTNLKKPPQPAESSVAKPAQSESTQKSQNVAAFWKRPEPRLEPDPRPESLPAVPDIKAPVLDPEPAIKLPVSEIKAPVVETAPPEPATRQSESEIAPPAPPKPSRPDLSERAARQYANGFALVRRNAEAFKANRPRVNIAPHIAGARTTISNCTKAAAQWSSTCAKRIVTSSSIFFQTLNSRSARLKQLTTAEANVLKARSAAQLSGWKARGALRVSAFKAKGVPALLQWKRSTVARADKWRSRWTEAVQEFTEKAVEFRAQNAAPQPEQSAIDIIEPAPEPGPSLRFKLQGLPLRARIAVARLHSEWRLQSQPISQNARLWTSLALGALSALMVMAIFSATVHYGKAALPGQHSSVVNASEGSVVPAAVSPAKITNVKRTRRQADMNLSPSPEGTTNQAKPAETASAAKAPTTTTHRKAHRTADDDYVAKDTYVYYGSSSR